MNYEKILPMHYPVITSYPTHANILSCVMQYEDSLQWFYDYYIQLFGGRDVSQGCYMDFFAPISWKSCPWINYQRISRDLIAKKWDSITEFFIECINSGYYLFLYLDQFHIPDSDPYQDYHFMHDTFIFGYNTQENSFNVADFYKNSKYGYGTVSFSQLEDAYNDASNINSQYDFLQGIVLIKPVKYEGYTCNTNTIATFLNDYLLARTTSKGYTDGYRPDVEHHKEMWCFGVDVYELLMNHIETCFADNSIEVKSFHALVDHKTLMLMRIKHLSECKYLSNANLVYDGYKEIEKQTLVLRNTVIKYVLSKNEKTIKSAMDLIPRIKIKEQQVIETFLDNLK